MQLGHTSKATYSEKPEQPYMFKHTVWANSEMPTQGKVPPGIAKHGLDQQGRGQKLDSQWIAKSGRVVAEICSYLFIDPVFTKKVSWWFNSYVIVLLNHNHASY